MHVAQFPASAVKSLLEGYCEDFVTLSAVLAQTLEQVTMRGLSFDTSRPALQRIETGMRGLADAIQEMLARAPAPPPERRDNASGVAPQTSASGARPSAPAATGPSARPQPPSAKSPATSAGIGPAPAPRTPTAQPPSAAPKPATGAAPPPRPRADGAPAASARPASAPVAGARPGTARPSEGLRGTNESMPLLSVFQFLGRMRKAGTMRVDFGAEQITFDLQNGCLLATTSSMCPWQERLGELLVELGACTPEALAPVIAQVGAGAIEPFGQLAVEQGIVSAAQVTAALELQVTRRFSRACKAPQASYEFVEGARCAADAPFRIRPMPIG